MADKYVTLIDYTIGQLCANSEKSFAVGPKQHPKIALGFCAGYAKSKPGNGIKLRVLAHGAEVGLKGGFGIAFGDSIYSWELPSIFSTVNGAVDEIVFGSCSIAEGDGRSLLRKVAAAANANVWASDQTQLMGASQFPAPPFEEVQMGGWMGEVYMFPKDGGEPKLMLSVPIQKGSTFKMAPTKSGRLIPGDPVDYGKVHRLKRH